MFAYRVRQHTFSSPFAALVFAAHNHPHDSVEFYANDHVYRDIDWSKEPSESWEDLLAQRAKELRANNDRLILAFSGGTDSITVYNTMIKHGIFIDEILISYADNNAAAPKSNATWAVHNHKDLRTKITVMDRYDPTWLPYFSNEEWVLDDHGSLRRYELTVPGPEVQQHCEDSYPNQRWCLVTGHEKPHLMFKDGQWWATHLDKVYHAVMGWPNLEPFFLGQDPRLHVKQCHMLKAWCKKNIKNPSAGWNSPAVLGKESSQHYDRFARACGRDLDVTAGTSFVQKNYAAKYLSNDTRAILHPRKNIITDTFLKDHLSVGTPWGLQFQRGWQSLQSDRTLLDYMRRHKLLNNRKQPINDYNGIWSKKYSLGK
jgi:hypothetical protein